MTQRQKLQFSQRPVFQPLMGTIFWREIGVKEVNPFPPQAKLFEEKTHQEQQNKCGKAPLGVTETPSSLQLLAFVSSLDPFSFS